MNPSKSADPGPLIDPSLSRRVAVGKVIPKRLLNDWLRNGVPEEIFEQDEEGFTAKGFFKGLRTPKEKLAEPKRNRAK